MGGRDAVMLDKRGSCGICGMGTEGIEGMCSEKAANVAEISGSSVVDVPSEKESSKVGGIITSFSVARSRF